MYWIIENWDTLGAVAAAVHAVALAVVNLTPTPRDDAALAGLYKAVEKLAGLLSRRAKQDWRAAEEQPAKSGWPGPPASR